jgi:hypothetical protein
MLLLLHFRPRTCIATNLDGAGVRMFRGTRGAKQYDWLTFIVPQAAGVPSPLGANSPSMKNSPRRYFGGSRRGR